MKYKLVISFFLLLFPSVYAQNKAKQQDLVTFLKVKGSMPLFENGKAIPLCLSSSDFDGVIRAAKDLQEDIFHVCGNKPEIYTNSLPKNKALVIIGTLGKNSFIEELFKNKKINTKNIHGKWEAFLIQTVKNPFPGIEQALVIAGSDKRGTIFGMYEVSSKIGVSPWHWWADVKPEHRQAIYIKPGRYEQQPSVKYRGIFLNDEYPNLTRWVAEKYGLRKPGLNPPVPRGVANYNSSFYSKVFELILRLKGNYLWPAMWNNAFNEDDPRNPELADEYGIVMGTSHQEPMMRAQKEWDRRYLNTLGSWNYKTFPDTLHKFWTEGIRRNKSFENLITIGLRGADDTEMASGGPEANMNLLESIVDVQRKIIADEINKEITQIPQVWCLYKEVLDYYKAGMRVPDDVTLLWAEDNWGNVRRLPTEEERKRSGGAGIYYHFDYHGGPRSYQWINTSPISRIWDQMSLAKQYGADRVWIVNVGHLRGYELPLEYFMDLAWNTDRWTNNNILEYTRLWASLEFGARYADETADIISKYTKYNGRRKPELLSPSTYSVIHYREAENVVADYNTIAARAQEIYEKLSGEKKDAFYHLVLFPVKACAIVNELYFTAGKNALYAKQARSGANDMAQKTRDLFSADTSLMGFYNRIFANGRWNHFMDQAHLGYVSWNDPHENNMGAIDLKEVEMPDSAIMGIAIEGSELSWPGAKETAILPAFDIFNRQSYFFEVFNKGKVPFEFLAISDNPWIRLSEKHGKVENEKRIWVNIDWDLAPKGWADGTIKISGNNKEVIIKVKAHSPIGISPQTLQGFVEADGCVSIEAAHFTTKNNKKDRSWIEIEDYGHTLSAMRAYGAANAPAAEPLTNSPNLEYRIYFFNTGTFDIQTILSPTLNFMPDRAMRYAISIDDEVPQIVTAVPEKYDAQNGNRDWEKSVSDNARFCHSMHLIGSPGYHTLKVWMVDPGVVLQKIVINTGGVKPSYLGPPESFYGKKEK